MLKFFVKQHKLKRYHSNRCQFEKDFNICQQSLFATLSLSLCNHRQVMWLLRDFAIYSFKELELSPGKTTKHFPSDLKSLSEETMSNKTNRISYIKFYRSDSVFFPSSCKSLLVIGFCVGNSGRFSVRLEKRIFFSVRKETFKR